MENSQVCGLELPQKALRGLKFKNNLKPTIKTENLDEITPQPVEKDSDDHAKLINLQHSDAKGPYSSGAGIQEPKQSPKHAADPELTDESFSECSDPAIDDLAEYTVQHPGYLFESSPNSQGSPKSRVKMVIKPLSRRLFEMPTPSTAFQQSRMPQGETSLTRPYFCTNLESQHCGLIPYDRASFGSPKGEGTSKSLNGSPKSPGSKQMLRLNLQRQEVNTKTAQENVQNHFLDRKLETSSLDPKASDDYGFLTLDTRTGDGISSLEPTTRGGSTFLGVSSISHIKNLANSDLKLATSIKHRPQLSQEHENDQFLGPSAHREDSNPMRSTPKDQGQAIGFAAPTLISRSLKNKWETGNLGETWSGAALGNQQEPQESGPLLAGEKKVPLAPRNARKIAFNFEKANNAVSERTAPQPIEPVSSQGKTSRSGVTISFNKASVGFATGMANFATSQFQNHSNSSSPVNSNPPKVMTPSQRLSPKNSAVIGSLNHQVSGSKGSLSDGIPLKLGANHAGKRVSKKLILEIPENPIVALNPAIEQTWSLGILNSAKHGKPQGGITATHTTPANPQTPERSDFPLTMNHKALVTSSAGNLLSEEYIASGRDQGLSYHNHKQLGLPLSAQVGPQVATIYQEARKVSGTSMIENSNGYLMQELEERLRAQELLIADLRANLEQTHVRNEVLAAENADLKMSFAMLQHKHTTLLKSLCPAGSSATGMHTSQTLSSHTNTVDLRASDPKLLMLASHNSKFTSGFTVANGLVSSSQKVIEEKTPERGKGSQGGLITFQQIAKEWSISNSGSKDIKQTLISQKNFAMKERIKELDVFGGSKLTPGKKSLLTPGVVQNLGSVGGTGFTSQFSSGTKRHTGLMMTPKGTNKVTFHSKSRPLFTQSRA